MKSACCDRSGTTSVKGLVFLVPQSWPGMVDAMLGRFLQQKINRGNTFTRVMLLTCSVVAITWIIDSSGFPARDIGP